MCPSRLGSERHGGEGVASPAARPAWSPRGQLARDRDSGCNSGGARRQCARKMPTWPGAARPGGLRESEPVGTRFKKSIGWNVGGAPREILSQRRGRRPAPADSRGKRPYVVESTTLRWRSRRFADGRFGGRMGHLRISPAPRLHALATVEPARRGAFFVTPRWRARKRAAGFCVRGWKELATLLRILELFRNLVHRLVLRSRVFPPRLRRIRLRPSSRPARSASASRAPCGASAPVQPTAAVIDEQSGWGGIRTPGTVSRTAVFKTAALDHSATHPVRGTAAAARPRFTHFQV